jgi:hypothetical protein
MTLLLLVNQHRVALTELRMRVSCAVFSKSVNQSKLRSVKRQYLNKSTGCLD